jgi:hypothetical protein
MVIERLVLVAPAAPGNKGDEGMLLGALTWTSVLADVRCEPVELRLHMLSLLSGAASTSPELDDTRRFDGCLWW